MTTVDLELEATFELPARHVLSLVGPSLSDGLLSYANAAQTTPTSQGSATSSPLYGQALSTATGTPNGATVQNVDSPTSSGVATIINQ
jgi:hypothetical protein